MLGNIYDSRRTPPNFFDLTFAGKYKEKNTRINLELYDILNIDVIKETVLLEPQVTMGQLTAALIPLGWTVLVLPELDDLTVGLLIFPL